MKARVTEASSHDLTGLGSGFADTGSFAERYRVVRGFTTKLCEPLATEDYVIQSMPDVSPTKWHLAHTTWFLETFVLKPYLPGYKEFHARYAYLFNSYYVQAGERHSRPKRGLVSRPTVEDVYRYRAHVDEYMLEWLETADPGMKRTIAPLIVLGLNHEQQHQELILTDIKHVFSCNPLRPAYHEQKTGRKGVEAALGWIDFEGGLCEIGHEGEGFAYDNEMPRHRAFVEPYRLASRPVTNGEYLQFIEGGGYERPAVWLSDGWDAAMAHGWSAPQYWEKLENRWHVYTLAGMREIEEAEPVCHVSYFEADAYARWSGARLPTEQELEVALQPVEVVGNFAEQGHFHPIPANARGNVAAPLQMYGDLWEWTRSPYSPYPGYNPVPGAIGEYNGKFMCNQFVLRGGSCVTSATHIRSTYRSFFYPKDRWQFSGIRLAKDA